MLNVLIVDDDKNGREFLQELLLQHFPGRICVQAMCGSVTEAVSTIRQFHPDLVFLDIEMPQGSGFELMEKLEAIDFGLIFVTAYSNYALKAIKFHAFDYLLKPIDPEELKRAVIWAERNLLDKKQTYDSRELIEKIRNTLGIQNLGVPTQEGVIFLPIEHIVRCEASSNYSVIYSDDDKKILVSRTLKELEDALINHNFVRVHKSHVISLKRISHYYRKEGTIQLEDGSSIPLGRNCKAEFEKRILMV